MNEFLWQNGERVDRITISVPTDRSRPGFWLGDGLFETMLLSDGEIFAKERHLRRFEEAKNKLGLEGKSLDFESGLNEARGWLEGECGQIRLTYLSSGDIVITARSHVIPSEPLKLVHYPYPKNERSVLAGVKTLSYGENGAALRYAKQEGSDDVVFTNTLGFITESALANLLLWDGAIWWTPTLQSGCLPGLTRELLLEFFGVKERDFLIDDLRGMKALALTSALRDVQPVSHFQGHSYSGFSEVGRLRREFQDWRAKNPHP
jgi:branched-chain amino acid aminotransferase